MTTAGRGGAPLEMGPVPALKGLLFHEPWWLSAVTDGRYREAIVTQGSEVVGRLPYVTMRRGPFHISRMPPFTHLLGPIVDAGPGKPQTRLARRLSITRSLIDQLPSVTFLTQHFDPSIDDGLAAADGLAFQDRGFQIAPQYTFEINCRESLDDIWKGMHFKSRQHIRRAEEKFSVCSVDEPKHFVEFYLDNIKLSARTNRIDFECFPALFSECRTRGAGEIIGAFDSNGEPIAMAYLVWGHGVMYYLLSTRAPNNMNDNGSINLLLWTAIKRAHQHGLIFDLDGIYSSGTARFLSGFGGLIKTRLVVRRSRLAYRALQVLKARYLKDDTELFS